MSKQLYIKLTDRCNFHCKHCYASCTRFGEDMSERVADILINNFKPEKERVDVIYHGGEPVLNYKILKKFVEAFKTNSFITQNITTNLNYKITKEILDIFKEIHYVTTSYDPDNIRFENINQLERWKQNCKILVENGIDLQINIVLTQNLLNLRPELFARFIKDIPCHQIHFERLTLTGRGSSVPTPKWEDVDSWLLEFYKINKEKFNLSVETFRQYQLLANGQLNGCFERCCSIKSRTINSDGTIATCPNAYQTIIGSVFDQQKYDQNILRILEAKERKKKIQCLSCDLYKYCNGDCFQQNWQGKICAFPKNLFREILKDEGND